MCIENNNMKRLRSSIIPPTPRNNLFALRIWNNVLNANKTICSPSIHYVLLVEKISLIYFEPRNKNRVNFSLP